MVDVRTFGVLAVWICMSATMIVWNAQLLRSFRHPISLTCWHQFVSVVLILCIRTARPSLLATGDENAGVPPLTFGAAVRLGMPVALCQSLGLTTSNAAFLYLSVAFIQMIKAWMPACVYASGLVIGTQKWSVPITKCLLTITVGLMITSAGELNFHAWGFALMIVALLAEGLRLNFLEVRLKSAGYKLNPLSSVMVFAPMVGVLLLIGALALDRSAFDMPRIDEVGKGVFVANALVAFLLNLVIYLAIQRASGLIFALAGVIKDIMIITVGFFFQGSRLSPTQVFGYTIALAGLQAYGIVSKSPADFESGVFLGLLRHLGLLKAEPAEKASDQVRLDLGEEDEVTVEPQVVGHAAGSEVVKAHSDDGGDDHEDACSADDGHINGSGNGNDADKV